MDGRQDHGGRDTQIREGRAETWAILEELMGCGLPLLEAVAWLEYESHIYGLGQVSADSHRIYRRIGDHERRGEILDALERHLRGRTP